MKKNLKIAAYINFLIAGFYLLINAIIPFTFLLASGIFYLTSIEKGKKYLKEKQIIILILALISIIFNFLASIFVFIALSKVNEKEPPVKKEKVDPEAKKIDILLKLGVLMVVLSGIIFATNSWEFLSDILKVFSLLLFSILFFFLSFYSKEKLKIKKTTRTYWNLGIVMFICSIITIGYFAILGSYLSFQGEGVYLLLTIILLIIAAFCYFSDQKFRSDNEYNYIMIISGLLAINFLLTHFNILLNYRLIILLLITASFYLMEKEFWHKAAEIGGIYIFPALFLIFSWTLATTTSYFLLVLAIIAFLWFHVLDKDDQHYLHAFAPLVTLILISVAICIYPKLNWEFFPLLMTGFLSILYVFGIFANFKLAMQKYLLMFINIGFLLILIILFANMPFINGINYSYQISIVSLILLTNLLNMLFDNNKITTIEKVLQPIKISAFIIVSYYVLMNRGLIISSDYLIHILYIIPLLLFILYHNSFMKRIYFITFFTIFLIALHLSLITTFIMPIFLIVVASIGLLITWLWEDVWQKQTLLIAFFVFLITIFAQIVLNEVFLTSSLYNSMIVIIIFGLIAYLTKKNHHLFSLVTLLTILPVYTLIIAEPMQVEYVLILTRSLFLIGIFLVDRLIFENKPSYNALTASFIVILIATTIFTPAIIIGLYMGLIGALLIYLGYLYKEYSFLFYIGVITTIINIIYHLWSIWTIIPIWAYLLIVGLSFIGFVTYRETKLK